MSKDLMSAARKALMSAERKVVSKAAPKGVCSADCLAGDSAAKMVDSSVGLTAEMMAALRAGDLVEPLVVRMALMSADLKAEALAAWTAATKAVN